jgi:hypothetical protein
MHDVIVSQRDHCRIAIGCRNDRNAAADQSKVPRNLPRGCFSIKATGGPVCADDRSDM